MDNGIDRLILAKAFSALVIVVVGIILWCFISDFCKKHISKENVGRKDIIIRWACGTLRIVIFAVGVLWILQIFGVNVSTAVAGLGIVSAIVGLALQDILKDVIMGVHIILDHFYSVSECVEYDGREGEVISFSLVTTKIADLDDRSVMTVCNRNIMEIRLLGERLDIDIPLSYGEDTANVNKVLSSVCKDIEKSGYVSECSFKGIEKFAESAIIYRIRIFCNPVQRKEVRREALLSVSQGLSAAGMHIPFNQLDVHIEK